MFSGPKGVRNALIFGGIVLGLIVVGVIVVLVFSTTTVTFS